LVRESGFENQKPEGHDAGNHNCLFHQWFEFQQYRRCLHQRARSQSQANGHRRTRRHAHRGDVRTGGRRMGSAAVRIAGMQGRQECKIRIIAHGSDVPSLRGQTVRTLIVNSNSLKTKHDAIMRFMDAYRESVDWMYSDPKAVEMYSAKIHRPVDLLKESMAKFQ